jgi:hypothetical protein
LQEPRIFTKLEQARGRVGGEVVKFGLKRFESDAGLFDAVREWERAARAAGDVPIGGGGARLRVEVVGAESGFVEDLLIDLGDLVHDGFEAILRFFDSFLASLLKRISIRGTHPSAAKAALIPPTWRHG